MADISSITLPGGGTYDLKDKNAVHNYGKGQNILRNWYWKNPINQRGENSYTFSSASYGIDAWKMNRGTITITSSGLVCTWNGSTTYQTNIQNIQNYVEIAGKTITMSALSSDGTIYKDTFTVTSSGSYVTSSGAVRFASSATSQALGVNVSSTTGITIVAVKAELGTEQTLAHQENGVWVLNEIPDYEYELYRCITSTADSSDTYANKSLATEQQLAYVESGTTASKNYGVGEYFCWNGLLHRAKTAISSGQPFNPGANCEAVTEGGLNDVAAPVGTDGADIYIRRIGKMVFVAYRSNVSPTAIANTIKTGLPIPDSSKSKTWQVQFMANIGVAVYPAFASVNSSGELVVSIVNNGAWATSGTYTCSFELFYVTA